MSHKKRVIVGISGGVDSSVAAFLLQKQGYDVIGIFMINWQEEGKCTWIEDKNDALLVAEMLKIPFQLIDFSLQYQEKIVDYLFSEYEKGRTPNPDILCNKKIKFDLFLKTAIFLDADFIATGHYVRKISFFKNGQKIYRLLSGKDQEKDQSYFLCQLNQYQLSKALFPLGQITKKNVRRIASEIGLFTAKKKDSQGICFIGKIRLFDFLKFRLKPKIGDIVEISSDSPIYHPPTTFLKREEELIFLSKKKIYKKTDGKIIGQHPGAYYFTKGQRKGLKVGGYKKALFVLEIDIKENILYVGMGKNHPGLYKKAFFVKKKDMNWIRQIEYSSNEMKIEIPVFCRVRYRQSVQKAVFHPLSDVIYTEFEDFQTSISEGQFATWYIGEELLGSGVISS
ncbi:MAG TPA: tRNA 2-thiouridine(34) synthase MnmA [Candidatus Angelobacter sp.]|jgi:tRNA-specific 2-thiouridylase|nr:tRNA 2-thiouridine(34) synthase MnmA [Candidatus Angelobacter sp.]